MTRRQLLAISFLSVWVMGAKVCPLGCAQGKTGPGQNASSDRILEFRFDSTLRHTARGTTLTFPITIDRLSPFGAGVRFQAASQPGGLSVRVEPAQITGASDVTLIVDVPAGAALGQYSVIVNGQLVVNGAVDPALTTRTGSVEVVTSDGNFTIVCDPAEITLLPGQSRDVSCRIERANGFVLPVELGVVTPPEFLAVTPPSARLEASAPVTFTVRRNPQGTAPAEFSLRLIGRATGHEREFRLRVVMPTL